MERIVLHDVVVVGEPFPEGNGFCIYEFFSRRPGAGNAAAALKELRKDYGEIAVTDIGYPGDKSYAFWRHMLENGLVGTVYDDQGQEHTQAHTMAETAAAEIVDFILEGSTPVGKYEPGHLAPPVWGNAKVPKTTAIIGSLPSGYACPGAKDCKSCFNPKTGKICDAPNIKYRCYDVAAEAYSPQARHLRWHNFNVLRGKSRDEMVEIMLRSIPVQAKAIRLHEGGDFFNQDHFDAWLAVAQRLQPLGVVIYAYTKSLPFWVKRLKQVPKNFRLNASYGGKYDELIGKHDLQYSKVVRSPEEAEAEGLPVNVSDEEALAGEEPFALLVHGGQPPHLGLHTDVKRNQAWMKQRRSTESPIGYASYADLLKHMENPTQESEAPVPTPPADESGLIILSSPADGPEDDDGIYDIIF